MELKTTPVSTQRCLRHESAFWYRSFVMAYRLRRRFLAYLLPAVLVFAQHGAVAHVVSHAGDNSADPEQTLIHLKLCDKCASAAKVTHLPAGQDLRLELLQAQYCQRAAKPTLLASAESTRNTCRDPPKIL
jgi:hypothetical protein